MPLQSMTAGVQGSATPKHVILVYWLLWALGTWQTANVGEAFSEPPCLPEDRSSGRSSRPVPGLSSSGKERPLSQERTVETDATSRQTSSHSHTSHLLFYGPIRLTRDSFTLPKKPPSLLYSFPYWQGIQSSILSCRGQLRIFPGGPPMCTWGQHVNTLLFVSLLLVCVSLQGS